MGCRSRPVTRISGRRPDRLIEEVMLVTKAALATVLSLSAVLQSCIGAGDIFAEKRTVVGDYFLMPDRRRSAKLLPV
jgi:hypothetical protein